MSSGLADFERRMKQLAATYERTPRDVVAASARTYKTAIAGSIGAATHGNRLRGVGKWNGGNRPGARVGVKSTVFGGAHHAVAYVQATGPLHLLERDNRDHDVPRTLSSRRLRLASGRFSAKRESTGKTLLGRKLLVINGNVITGPVHVRGSKGKHPFERGVNSAERAAFLASVVALGTEVSKVFK